MSNLTLPRRDLVAAGLAAGAAGMLPAVIAGGQPVEVPRNRTLILIKNCGRDGRWVDHELCNRRPA